MNRSVINAAIAIAICFAVNMWQVGLARADLIIDDFEASLIPSGDPIGYFSFGTQLSDRGVSNAFGSTSGTNSAFYVINFNLVFVLSYQTFHRFPSHKNLVALSKWVKLNQATLDATTPVSSLSAPSSCSYSSPTWGLASPMPSSVDFSGRSATASGAPFW